MQNVGIHVGRSSIFVSQFYKGRHENHPRFETKVRANYGIEKWYSYYQGFLPNAYDEESESVGYEALEIAGLAKAVPFDASFFGSMLADDPSAEKARRIWTKLLQNIRKHYVSEESLAQVAIYLEGVDLAGPKNRWTPWKRSPDRSPELEKIFDQFGGTHLGLAPIGIVTEHDIVRAYLQGQPKISDGDMLASFGSSKTQIWRIDQHRRPQYLEALPGSLAMLGFTLPVEPAKEADYLAIASLLRLKNGMRETMLSQRLVDKLNREILMPLRKTATNQGGHLYLGGEGASIIDALEDGSSLGFRILDEPGSLHAHGAAAYSYYYANGGLG